jgi:hypothetical protein
MEGIKESQLYYTTPMKKSKREMPEMQGNHWPAHPPTSFPEPAGQQTQVPNDEFPVLLPLFLHLNAQANQPGIIPRQVV